MLILLAQPRPDWFTRAACIGVDPDLFFPDRGGPVAEAKAVCRSCPVCRDCLEFALAEPAERFGVWGGLSERERRVLASQPSSVRCCPLHGLVMSGGPGVWHCPAGRAEHRVTVTDLETAARAGKDAA